MNKENLLKLSEFLMENKLPFTMEHYRANIVSDESDQYYVARIFTLDELDKGLESCGTAGCALGWSPFVIPPSEKAKVDGTYGLGGLDLGLYTEETFGILSPEEESSVFDYDWTFVDDSRQGAAFRLAQLANHGIVYESDVDVTESYFKARDQWVVQWEQANENK
ncbi:hypothetical protein [Alishewanella phage vB_AspM_Slicko01]|nr:hypothetical protein [Alishewanella phage vB_AspM_Slicko01]